MNINHLRDNLERMGEEERAAAEELLTSLGIPFSKKPKPQRQSFTSRLSPHYERIDFTCLTCGNQYSKHFHFLEKVMHGQHCLVAHPISKDLFEMLDIPTKTKSSVQCVCKKCNENLMTWSKESLISILLEMRKGGAFKKEDSDA